MQEINFKASSPATAMGRGIVFKVEGPPFFEKNNAVAITSYCPSYNKNTQISVYWTQQGVDDALVSSSPSCS